ncbi:MFS transporter, partial [Rhizobium ruizarguesonis]
WYISHRRQNASKPAISRTLPLPQNRVIWALLILVLLTATKNVYMASVSSYFTFYVIDKFALSSTRISSAQMTRFCGSGRVRLI